MFGKHFMTRDYARYGNIDLNGVETTVSRTVCFSYDETSFTGEFPQLWWWTYESDFVIRLPRNEYGKELDAQARKFRDAELNGYLEKIGAVSRGCKSCRGWKVKDPVTGERKCVNCPKSVSFVELDRNWQNDDGVLLSI